MFPVFHNPESLHGIALDKYLDKGWFRAGQRIYTLEYILLKGELYKPIRIRLALQGNTFRKGLRKLWKKNQQFRTTYQKSKITKRKEQLYQQQIMRLEGYVSPNLKDSLLDGGTKNIYDTHEVAVYHKNKLIAVSFFDLGEKTMASINAVYDPDYQQYSLGFYTMLAEIEYGKQHGFEYYYPGYVIPNFPKFDYKLRIGDVEFYNALEDIWYPIDELNDTEMFSEVIENIDYYKGKYY